MTRSLFEAYKKGKWKPYNRYFIETYKPVFIPKYLMTRIKGKEYWRGGKLSTQIPVNDVNLVTTTFNGKYITFTINCLTDYFDWNERKVYAEVLPPFTVTVNYKNIKKFH